MSGEPRMLRLFKQASLPTAFGGTSRNPLAVKQPRHSSSLMQTSAFMLTPIFGGFPAAQKTNNFAGFDHHHVVSTGGNGGGGGGDDIIMLPAIASNVILPADLGKSSGDVLPPTGTLRWLLARRSCCCVLQEDRHTKFQLGIFA